MFEEIENEKKNKIIKFAVLETAKKLKLKQMPKTLDELFFYAESENKGTKAFTEYMQILKEIDKMPKHSKKLLTK